MTQPRTISPKDTQALNDALASGDPEVFQATLAEIAINFGITEIARDSGLSRESLYKSMKTGAKPRYDTVLKVLWAMGVKLKITTGQ
jgi:probable addiction module antidote protein